jgi:hypothetical protein
VTISAIPGTYINLEMMILAYDSGGGDIWFQMNGDTTQGHYQCQRFFTAAPSGQTCGALSVAGGNAFAGKFDGSTISPSATKITIPMYTSTVLTKSWTGTTFDPGTPYTGQWGGYWQGNTAAAAITSIKIASSNASNITGSLTLYGTN